MRIVNEWNHKDIKVTAFVMNNRYSLKFEKFILEQWYKFRDGQFENIDEIKALLNDEFYDKLDDIFVQMAHNRAAMFTAMEEEHGFDQII